MSDSPQEGFKFTCPFCTQRIRGYAEHVGSVVNCPSCEEQITVPNPDSGFHHVNHTSEGMWGFDAREWQVLQGEDYEAVERLIAYPRQCWWECGAAAELLSSRLQLLETSMNTFRETYYHQGTDRERLAFINRTQEAIREFCDIVNFTYHAMTHDLQEAATSNQLMAVIRFADRIGREIHRLRIFHEDLYSYSLPQENPCPTIHQITTTWVPTVVASLKQAVEQLRERAEYHRDIDMQVRLTVSLFPPNMIQLEILLEELKNQFGVA